MKEDIKQLKNMKRREIMDKLDKLREITGDPDLEFEEEDLETEFDPQKHDEMMKVINFSLIHISIKIIFIMMTNAVT